MIRTRLRDARADDDDGENARLRSPGRPPTMVVVAQRTGNGARFGVVVLNAVGLNRPSKHTHTRTQATCVTPKRSTTYPAMVAHCVSVSRLRSAANDSLVLSLSLFLALGLTASPLKLEVRFDGLEFVFGRVFSTPAARLPTRTR